MKIKNSYPQLDLADMGPKDKYRYWRRLGMMVLQEIGSDRRKKYKGKTPKQIDKMFFKMQDNSKYIWWKRDRKVGAFFEKIK